MGDEFLTTQVRLMALPLYTYKFGPPSISARVTRSLGKIELVKKKRNLFLIVFLELIRTL